MNRQPTNILVVDDETEIRFVLRTLLNMGGYQVFESEDGLKALHLLEKQNIDLILSDMRMPNCDGMDFFFRIKEAKITIPFLFMSGYSDIGEIEVLKLGASGFISKPFDIATLLKTIERVLGTKSHTDQGII